LTRTPPSIIVELPIDLTGHDSSETRPHCEAACGRAKWYVERARNRKRELLLRTGAVILAAAAVIVSVLAPTPSGAASVEHTMRFSEGWLTIERIGGFDRIALRGCDVTREPGKPELPVYPLTLSLPEGARAVTVEVVSAESSELLGVFRPQPAQNPRILPAPGIDLPIPEPVAPDPSVYEGETAFPGRLVELTSRGTVGTTTLVGAIVYPMQFVPDQGKLRFFNTIRLRIDYETGGSPGRGPRPALSELTEALASNPVASSPARRQELEETLLGPGDYEHVIISGNPVFDDALAPLAAWKTQKGVPSTIVDRTWIEATYSGADAQEKIRNFIADASQSWGTVWFLLAGAGEQMPTRRTYAMTSEAGAHPDEDAIACDLYFADLDGDWDSDGDGVYGELADGVDLYPDVFVGRAPLRSLAHVESFVAKLLEYERADPAGDCLDMLMAAEVLWVDPMTDSGIALNLIDRESVPPRFDPIDKLYETLGNETVESVKAALNGGKGHFLHSGHAWHNAMGCGDGLLYRWDIFEMTNGAGQPLIYSIGCWPAAFDLDTDCIAERFLQNPSGGGVAFVGNSRYGWASPGNPGFGYSERFMQLFYRALFVDRLANVGSALAAAKASLIPLSQAENVYRWHQYELNLLGDPEMPVWTADPAELTVSMPDSIVPGPSVLSVAVRTAGGPVEDALVCATNGGDVYERARTSSDGVVALSVDTALPDSLTVTVTAADCRPYERRIPVTFTGAFVRASSYELDDSAGGNGDGLAGPGETVSLALRLHNLGTDTADDVSVTLWSDDPMITVLDGAAGFGSIAPGETADGPSFSLAVAADCEDGHTALIDVSASPAGRREVWTEAIGLTVAAPVLVPTSYSVSDAGTGGDGDGVVEPGETIDVAVTLENGGHATAAAPHVTPASNPACATMLSGPITMPDVGVGESVTAVLRMSLAPSCPQAGVVEVELDMVTSNGISSTASFFVTVGIGTFAHDFEDGDSGWSASGESGSWALTDNRSHSGTHSWYCGEPGAWQYADGAECRLTSPEFVLGIDVELSFWCWYELPIYHEDGFYVELVTPVGEPVDTLDFIGSGGALGALGSIGNDWLQYSYRLAGEPGETLRVRFRFTSDDAEVAEGVYIDDVSLTTSAAPDDTGSMEPGDQALPMVLYQNLPNPFSPATKIRFTTYAHAEIELAVYNIQGRLIRTLERGYRTAGDHEVVWDGTDEFGGDVAAGVYLYRLRIGEDEETRKMILIR
jgi:hypothetical protein